MDTEDISNELENIDLPKMSPLQHQQQLKLAILNARKSAFAGIWLLIFPVLVMVGALMKGAFHLSLPPWSWLVEHSHIWPLWLRVTIWVSITIAAPIIAVFLNMLSIIWLQYDKKQKILNISVRMRLLNIVIIIIAGFFALIFFGHFLADWLAGK